MDTNSQEYFLGQILTFKENECEYNMYVWVLVFISCMRKIQSNMSVKTCGSNGNQGRWKSYFSISNSRCCSSTVCSQRLWSTPFVCLASTNHIGLAKVMFSFASKTWYLPSSELLSHYVIFSINFLWGKYTSIFFDYIYDFSIQFYIALRHHFIEFGVLNFESMRVAFVLPSTPAPVIFDENKKIVKLYEIIWKNL